jgi:putative ABC transport system ATP-binding protein
MIEMRGVTKTYQMGENAVHALVDIDLDVADHEFVAVIGPSGSGKSTLMNIMGCLDIPNAGTYVLDGENVSECSEKQLGVIRNRKIGFVFQQFNLLQKLTALDNVALPLVYARVPDAERKERALAALECVGLSDRTHHRPSELSGGQQQRVAIARALVTNPALILADEPTGNLDSHSGLEILNILTDLHKAGNTVVLITHDQRLSQRAQRSVHLSDGRIVNGNGNTNGGKRT